ncbi:SGNH/GDSL hydrolase family protein [Cellulomonas cellasea]|uniref:SGNH/GDSL hydrolase family protein n=1 Tax=Cellulomonas cellasea TaxID=43670 RepID=UPI0025A48A86|nr:SGNH/GDSL hydrolase family protein [Cellulomonas cellasea]MDM8083437.1 SGNH/GDSL hydrolase family protein [Cellulomonas cellasea]
MTPPQPTTGHAGPPWARYVALGDSFTEGLWDQPVEGAPCRGWADMLASKLSARRVDAGQEPLEYANLAVRGLLLHPIIAEQLPPALDFAPDLVSLVGGGNNMLRPTADVDAMARELEQAVEQATRAGAHVLMATGMDAADSLLVRRSRNRTAVFNSHVWSIARRHGASVLDLWGIRSLRDWRMWSADRIHLTTEGHARVAQGALVALGLAPDDPDWDDPLTPLPPTPRIQQARDDVQWMREHLYPWATRRLRRTGPEGRVAKRPDLAPVVDARSGSHSG